MHLILLRHADALEGSNDMKRELSKKGRKQAKTMTKWIADRIDRPFEVWSSPAARAIQTLEPLGAKIVTNRHLIPTATSKSVLNEIQKTGFEKNLLVCGHMPWIALVGLHYLDANPFETSLNFKKAGAMWLEITKTGDWTSTRLVSFVNPQDLI